MVSWRLPHGHQECKGKPKIGTPYVFSLVCDKGDLVAMGVSLFNRGKQSSTSEGADTIRELVPNSQKILPNQDGGGL
jgi:hypothetical protein